MSSIESDLCEVIAEQRQQQQQRQIIQIEIKRERRSQNRLFLLLVVCSHSNGVNQKSLREADDM